MFCLYTFPAHNLNFHWKWRWWDWIQAIFLFYFYFIRNALQSSYSIIHKLQMIFIQGFSDLVGEVLPLFLNAAAAAPHTAADTFI